MTAYGDVLDQMSALERSIWVARFWSKVDVGGPRECWFWSAAGSITDNGYGRVSRPDRHGNWMAHRVAYELVIGRIPDGLTLDHLCRVRHCVNPLHLEPVTSRENVLRGIGPSAMNSRKTHCIHGHELVGRNVYITPSGDRHCRVCKNRNRRTGGSAGDGSRRSWDRLRDTGLTAAQMRLWAEENGLEVRSKGSIPHAVLDAFEAWRLRTDAGEVA